MLSLESLHCHPSWPIPIFGGEGKCWFCGVDVNTFEKHSFHPSLGCLCRLFQNWQSQTKLASSQKAAFNLSINLHGVLTRHEYIQMLSLLVLTGGGEGTTVKGLAALTVIALIRFSAVISCF